MNILIDILHPAHVHFFRGFISAAKARGHNIVITTRNKEITNALLDRFGISYIHVSNPATGKIGQMWELLTRWIKMAWIIRRKKIDIAMSISGLCTGFPAWICNVPNIAFSDTEDATLSNKLSIPFCTYFVTPEFFLHDVGRTHLRYKGLHETAYLKKFNFEAAKEQLKAMNLPERYVIMRLVANDALHDEGIKGIQASVLENLIEELKRFGQVFITSQTPLPEKLAQYRLQVPIEQVHAVLAGAMLFVGDSPTMSVESSVLGTPAFLLTSRWNRLGNMIGLEKQFSLLRNFAEFEDLVKAIREIKDPIQLKQEWSERAAKYREYVEDVELLIDRLMTQALASKGITSEQPA